MKQICENCKYYIQHYVRHGRGYGIVYCGHCCYPRLKSRKPDTPACKHYKEKAESLL